MLYTWARPALTVGRGPYAFHMGKARGDSWARPLRFTHGQGPPCLLVAVSHLTGGGGCFFVVSCIFLFFIHNGTLLSKS